MSGHSKWSSIKHKKGAADAKRGALFTKLTRAITVAAREGGGDIEGNPSLALAVQKAKDNSMPKDNIERAINKGTGADQDADAFERIVYEGYGPGGAALLVDALTDNRNRTGSEVRHTFSKFNGTLGEPGSVNYLFERKGELLVDASLYYRGRPDGRHRRRRRGRGPGRRRVRGRDRPHRPHRRSARRWRRRGCRSSPRRSGCDPRCARPVEEGDAGTLMKLIDALEENDDVQAVHGNFDVDDAVLERVASAG